MKRTLYGIAALFLVVGCGGLASSNGGDAGGDRSSRMDSGLTDVGALHHHDAATDVHANDSTAGDVSSDVVGADGGPLCGSRIDGGGQVFGPCGKGETCCGVGPLFGSYYCVVADAGCPALP